MEHYCFSDRKMDHSRMEEAKNASQGSSVSVCMSVCVCLHVPVIMCVC